MGDILSPIFCIMLVIFENTSSGNILVYRVSYIIVTAVIVQLQRPFSPKDLFSQNVFKSKLL